MKVCPKNAAHVNESNVRNYRTPAARRVDRGSKLSHFSLGPGLGNWVCLQYCDVYTTFYLGTEGRLAMAVLRLDTLHYAAATADPASMLPYPLTTGTGKEVRIFML
eukprot:g41193.t1